MLIAILYKFFCCVIDKTGVNDAFSLDVMHCGPHIDFFICFFLLRAFSHASVISSHPFPSVVPRRIVRNVTPVSAFVFLNLSNVSESRIGLSMITVELL